jgi:hypothetical protein
VREAILKAQPDAMIHQATALASARFGRNLDRTFGPTNRLRTEGTDNLLAAARAAGVRRIVGQSFAPYRYARESGWIKTEDDPLDPHPATTASRTNAAMRYLENAVTDAGGVALRYGGFYGDATDALLKPVRKRMFPIVGDGGGSCRSFTLTTRRPRLSSHSSMTGRASTTSSTTSQHRYATGSRCWPARSAAKPPRHIPRWLARLIAGENAATGATEARGASNAKAKRELGWTLSYPSWRQGFMAAYASSSPTDRTERSSFG